MTRAQASAVPKRPNNCTMTVISLPQGIEGDRRRHREQTRNLLIGEPLYAIATDLQDESAAAEGCVNACLREFVKEKGWPGLRYSEAPAPRKPGLRSTSAPATQLPHFSRSLSHS